MIQFTRSTISVKSPSCRRNTVTPWTSSLLEVNTPNGAPSSGPRQPSSIVATPEGIVSLPFSCVPVLPVHFIYVTQSVG